MTLTATTVKISYNGDNTTTAFPVTFVFWDVNDFRVVHTDAIGTSTDWTRGTQYNVTRDVPSGATLGTINIITLPIDYTPQTGEKLTIISNLPDTQGTSLPLGGPLPSTAIEQRLDQITRLVQQRSEELDRAPKFVVSEAQSSIGDLPSVSIRSGRFLAFDSDGKPIAAVGTSANLGPVTPFINTVLDDVDALTAKQTLNTLFNDINSQTITYSVVASDDGKLILYTGSGGVTLNLLTAASAGNCFVFSVQNASAGTVTIDPSGSELINGAATLVLNVGHSAIVLCNGTSWRALEIVPGSSGTLTSTTIISPIINGTATGTGTLGGSIIVPLARMQRTEVSAENASPVTGISSATVVVTVDCGTVTAGDRILVSGTASLGNTGASSPKSSVDVNKNSGTASIQTYHNNILLLGEENAHATGNTLRRSVSGVIKVTSSGTLVLALRATCLLGTGDVAAGNGQLHVIVLQG